MTYDCEDCIGMKMHGCYCQAMGAVKPGGPVGMAVPAILDAYLVIAHGPNISYPSRTAAQYVRNVLRDVMVILERQSAQLREADDLLEVAYYAHQKMGLEGQGNQGLPHEVRMFAMHFSQPEEPKTPLHVILAGDGRYWKFRNRKQ